LLRGRVHNVRGKGKSAFLVLRQQTATVQVTFFGDILFIIRVRNWTDDVFCLSLTVDDVNVSKGMVKWVSNLTKESVVDIQGVIMAPESGKVESCTQQDVELVAQSIYCVSRSVPRLPFEIDDASRPETDFDKEDCTYVRVGQDTRLNHRVIDLRTPANQAIFRVQSAVCELFRDALR
jgi:aspartyl-tRNA synthetase